MELFRNPNIDFLSKKWVFVSLSLALMLVSIASMGIRYAKTGSILPWGVDFKGGTLVYVKFTSTPNEDHIRAAMDRAGLRNARIQRYGLAANNEVLIALEQKETTEQALDQGKNQIIKALDTNTPEGKLDLNNIGYSSLHRYLLEKDPMRAGTNAEQTYSELARTIVDYRDKTRGGVLNSVGDIAGVVPAQVTQLLQADFFTSGFGVRNVEIVGPQVGAQLRKQALLATLYAMLGMLAYLWFRFELIYGVAAVAAVFHDTIITLGAFSLLNMDISLTVIAAILTLVGYSMNDTIVVFDRIRENVKTLRREKLGNIVNQSINQTLSRTVLTSGLTFLTVLSLFLFGGEVLRGFSLALVIGMLIGSYSSIFVASPMLVAYQEWRAGRSGRAGKPTPPERRERAKAKA
ncbi:MAG TPA: protein translocase subunit SecF [Clostridia bacterium]|nr:protein translocase subunit SecF [Clostridia bacterium]